MEIKIYTDGACIGNPGPGGWAAIILTDNEKKEIYKSRFNVIMNSIQGKKSWYRPTLD